MTTTGIGIGLVLLIASFGLFAAPAAADDQCKITSSLIKSASGYGSQPVVLQWTSYGGGSLEALVKRPASDSMMGYRATMSCPTLVEKIEDCFDAFSRSGPLFEDCIRG